MGEYTTYDFEESVEDMDAIARVVAAWGSSPEGYGSWVGGFLMERKDGRFEYVTGWCDTSGWGCQDGRYSEIFDALPDLAILTETAGKRPDTAEWGAATVGAEDWDHDPADLNKYLAERPAVPA